MIPLLIVMASFDVAFVEGTIDLANGQLVQVVSNSIHFSTGDGTCIGVIEFDEDVQSIDGNPRLPMVIVSVKPRNFVLVNLSTKAVTPLSTAVTWAPDGSIALAATSISLHLLPASDLDNCDVLKDCPGAVHIDGHPVGETVALRWLDAEQLLYRTGAGEITCFGIVDVAESQNYLLGCRTVGEPPKRFSHPEPVPNDYFLQRFGVGVP